MAGARNFKFRFGVGNPDGKHSMVWVVCIRRSDLYVVARCLGQTIKASIHATVGRQARLGDEQRLRSGGMLLEVSELLTTQTCSRCGCLPSSRPTGIAGLGIREWTCDDCGTAHDRDVNAAKNILRCGLTALAEGALTSRMGSPALRPRSGHNCRL
jgi:hypothetical protein